MKLNANKTNTHYQKIGKKGPYLILLHGWGCDWQIWHGVIVELSKKHRLIIPDLPTFGKSEEPKEVWSLKNYVDWLQEFIELVIKDNKFILAGHSFGGQIASVYAARKNNSASPRLRRASNNLEKLILVDSAGLADSLTFAKKLQTTLFGAIPEPIKHLVSNKFRRKILKLINSPTDHLDSSFYQRKVLKKVVCENIANHLINIETSTQIIWGRNDDATPLHQGEKFHRLIKNSKLEIFENSGHFPFIDEPIKFINTISK
ncbi:MAG: alpha/beta hydrolase [Patescibacteria group bacterium]